jgi:2-polyprenyl-3-methyl-5-hydroxy-6-metoxy-1,4-benzoquinol methylase
VNSPDQNAAGFLSEPPAAGRYENVSVDPDDVAAKLAALLPLGAKVLDVGCGTGSVSEVVAKLSGAKITGIEPDAERVALAKARGIEVFCGLLTEDFLRAHGPFDAVMFADVLEHLPDPSGVVALARRGLKPGGIIVASVPNVAHWFVRLDLLRGRFDYQSCGIMDATHLRWFTRRTIVEFFRQAGLHVTALDCTVNIELPDYRYRRPWCWLKLTHRRRLVGWLAKKFPGLFGCQHIVRAELLK